MAVTSAQVTVSTTAVALNPTETDTVGGVVLFVRNGSANGAHIGGTGVTAGTGYGLPAGASVGPLELPAGEQLFAIRTAAADATLDVLRLGA